ncbi:BldC family transcriptional regulator [Actinomadura rubrisoli]|uniref:BldC family transcriptional regulator n=1 Tax=Actinomadura rubrisoli TaxID=2530368 RepID=A0A4R5C9M2_9ACTN|nr:BldC family transcriptional regulator [Actinomadura rubrisoli]TDD95469.1 BldC family transcriptional regulator [Actinomadura rubrisoli]
MSQQMPDYEPLLTPGEVAMMFRVDPKTVSRWALEGWLPYTWTLGGHRRYPRAAILELLKEGAQPRVV